MLKIIMRGVTVAFVLWQVVAMVILLNNLDLVLEFYQQTKTITEEILGKLK